MDNSARQITATKAEIADAFRRWEEKAKAGNWPERTDDERHADNAEFFMDLVDNKT